MYMYRKDPDRALIIIDSALIVGNIDPFIADFLRAKVYAHSNEKPRLDDAITLCESLLLHDSTSVAATSTAYHRCNVLQLIMDSYRLKNDDERWLKYAIELAELDRKLELETEALRMEAEIGSVLTHLGRSDEGMNKLNDVIEALDDSPLSIDRMDAGIVARKRKIKVLMENSLFELVIPEAKAIIRKLDDYQRSPESYAEDSFRLPPNDEDRASYCDYYRAQAWGFIANAYALSSPANPAEARKYLSLFEKSEYGKSFYGRSLISPVWKALGEWNKLLAIDDEIVSRLGADTINADYANTLKDRADAALAQGHLAKAFSYLDRYTTLQRELDRQLYEGQAHEYAARYHASEQDRKIKEAESESAKKDIVIIFFIGLMLVSTAYAYHFALQRKRIKDKNQVLVRMINEQNEIAESASPEKTVVPDKELFNRIDESIRGEKLYTSQSLQRQDIIDRFDISRKNLNDLLSAFANGQSFTAYINSIRLQDAVSMLREEPDLSIADIADRVGFSPATFREQFKRQFGMTPTEYRQNL
ncbi:MAG: AraC family transcriptional regulator [Bacteroidales bacterium]|nr:AraC family transcriptional regulator [Bacteroidales bacterium]